MNQSGGYIQAMYSLPLFLPWISEYIIIDDAIYIGRMTLWYDSEEADDKYQQFKTDLFLVPLEEGEYFGETELYMMDRLCTDLQVLDGCLYTKDEEESEIVDTDEWNNLETDFLEGSDELNDDFSEDTTLSEYDLIGSWQALDEDTELVALQFLFEDEVLIKSGIASQKRYLMNTVIIWKKGQIIFGRE